MITGHNKNQGWLFAWTDTLTCPNISSRYGFPTYTCTDNKAVSPSSPSRTLLNSKVLIPNHSKIFSVRSSRSSCLNVVFWKGVFKTFITDLWLAHAALSCFSNLLAGFSFQMMHTLLRGTFCWPAAKRTKQNDVCYSERWTRLRGLRGSWEPKKNSDPSL